MLDILSLDPVSKIRLAFRRPEMARQACPAASPYPLPPGPVAPVSARPQSASSLLLTVSASKQAIGSVAERNPSNLAGVSSSSAPIALRV
jgi:hypothetical protein